jgi:type II secretory pathway pseudopilin PulG
MLGILAGVVLVQMSGSYEKAREALALERLEILNGNLKERAVSLREYVLNRSDSSTADELLVLMDLQYRNPDPAKADFNSPYIDPRYRPTTSSSSADYRLRWTGRMFELLRPGIAGSGLKLVFDGSDIGTPRTYPPNYSSSGR